MSQHSNIHNSSSGSANMFRAPLPLSSATSADNLIKSIRASKFSAAPTSSNSNTNGSRSSTRVSKFSAKPPESIPPPGVVSAPAPKLDAVAAAAAAAAKINANLKAKGKLSEQTLLKPVASTNPNLSLIKISETKKVFSSYVSKIDINDLPLSLRTHLTHVNQQDKINKETGVCISTKGQFLSSDEKKNVEGINTQLHLYIQSPSEEKTNAAVTKVKEIIAQHKPPNPTVNNGPPVPNMQPATPVRPVPLGQPTLPTGNFVQEKVFVGMDYCVPEFDLKSKLLGANYANFNFVANSTGAKVILRGRGSGFIEPTSGREAFESMYVFISHINKNGVDAAKQLVYNLISTVSSEYSTYMSKKMGNPPPPPTGNFPIPPRGFGQYPANPPAIPSNPYNRMTQPPPNQYLQNPYNVPPPIAPNQCPPVRNPYSAPGPPPALYNMPPPASNFATPPPRDIPQDPSSLNAAPSIVPSEPKTKRRRFQEEQPDDSNVLGYKQYSSHQDNIHNENDRRSRKKPEKPKTDNVQMEKQEDKRTSNLPFWMSYD